ncbi:MAG: hypothetical protein GYA73_00500, partial [Planctomycetes bacterium]|nr:hypothetical protein [Planctomycetota bacterium]
MNPFEIYLLRPPEGGAPADTILDALLGDGRVALAADDPSRAHYRNPDTGAFFSLLLASEVTEAWEARLAAARRAADEDAPPPPEPEEDYDGGEDEDFEADEDGGAEPDVEQAPVIITLPLLVMEFFMREALAFAEALARTADLAVDLHAGTEDGAQASSPAEIAATWLGARDEAVAEGLRLHAPGIVDPLVEYADELWAAVEQLPLVGVQFVWEGFDSEFRAHEILVG